MRYWTTNGLHLQQPSASRNSGGGTYSAITCRLDIVPQKYAQLCHKRGSALLYHVEEVIYNCRKIAYTMNLSLFYNHPTANDFFFMLVQQCDYLYVRSDRFLTISMQWEGFMIQLLKLLKIHSGCFGCRNAFGFIKNAQSNSSRV